MRDAEVSKRNRILKNLRFLQCFEFDRERETKKSWTFIGKSCNNRIMNSYRNMYNRIVFSLDGKRTFNLKRFPCKLVFYFTYRVILRISNILEWITTTHVKQEKKNHFLKEVKKNLRTFYHTHWLTLCKRDKNRYQKRVFLLNWI